MSEPAAAGRGGAGDPMQIGLIGLFVTALITAQLTAAKVIMFSLPVSIPVVGNAIILPGAALAIGLTFFATDCYAELYGQRPAQVLVNVAFLLNFVMLALVWTTIAAPVFPDSPVAAETFRAVMAPSTGVVLGSLAGYVVSQNWDVIVFHRLREYTDGDHLWLRNLASTGTSQLLDTTIFILVAFVAFQGLPLSVAVSLIAGQYLFKLLVALLDTPFVYGVVALSGRLPDAVGSHSTGSAKP